MTRVMMWPLRLYFRLRVMASQETPSKSKKISLRLADPPSREEVRRHTHSTMERPDMLRLKEGLITNHVSCLHRVASRP
jgi:hypothetical protein